MTIYCRRQEYMLGERRDTLTDIELHSLLRDWRKDGNPTLYLGQTHFGILVSDVAESICPQFFVRIIC